MTLKPLRILAVGRLRTPFWKDAADYYRSRLVRWRRLTETCLRDADPSLSPADRAARESRAILDALTPADIPICLDERGTCRTSREFASFLSALSEDVNRVPCFIIGGAFGYDDSVRRAARHLIAFGPLTLPHELARVVLFEQLYRAESILRNIPYHH
ncbi:MAG: 23S rRNA (pseudouridine(1915)-N(3))-methyltransferase RlmH [Desulfovibrionaceae bacterium]|nr:23S rRNA (pseudouridine(1915)-N(3))-methyltransferase RlmH [Desulfovibrionaceae bacterium]